VIIPLYEDSRIHDCVAAVNKQTYPAQLIEIIVVDNGRKKVAPLQGVRWLVENVPGSYRARNKGVMAACGDVLAFTDADCLPSPYWIENGVKALCDPFVVDIVGGEVELFPKVMNRPSAAELYELVWGFPQRDFVEKKGFSATANMLVWKWVVEDVGPFNESMLSGGDQEWGERAVALGKRLLFAEDAMVRHPARGSIRQLTRKYVRTFGGQYQLREQKRTDHIRALKKLVKKPFFAINEDIGYESIGCRLRYVGVHCILSGVQLFEHVRLSLGGKPRNF